MIIRHVPTVVPAEGVILERVLDATYPVWNGGLSRQAYGKLDAAQMKTAWGRHHQGRFALVDGAHVLASAAQYALAAILDQRPVRVSRSSASLRTAAVAMRRSWWIGWSTKPLATEP